MAAYIQKVVTTTDGTLQIFAGRDLESNVLARIRKPSSERCLTVTFFGEIHYCDEGGNKKWNILSSLLPVTTLAKCSSHLALRPCSGWPYSPAGLWCGTTLCFKGRVLDENGISVRCISLLVSTRACSH